MVLLISQQTPDLIRTKRLSIIIQSNSSDMSNKTKDVTISRSRAADILRMRSNDKAAMAGIHETLILSIVREADLQTMIGATPTRRSTSDEGVASGGISIAGPATPVAGPAEGVEGDTAPHDDQVVTNENMAAKRMKHQTRFMTKEFDRVPLGIIRYCRYGNARDLARAV